MRHLVALISLAAGLAGCGGQVGQCCVALPAHTQSYPNETASALPAGVDALTGLRLRPMRAPTMPPNGTCSVSSTADLGAVVPNYGAGVGPVYLSGQYSWYSAGQVAVIMVDSRYSGPLLVRTFQLGGDGRSTVALADFALPVKRERGVTVVSAVNTTDSGLYLEAVASTSLWRAWYGRLSTSSPGCFGLQVDGDAFTEFIVFEVNSGKPPPG